MFASINGITNRIVLLLVVSGVSAITLWWGFDSLRVGLFSSELTAFTIKEIENNGIGNKRHAKITDAYWDGSYVYQVTQKRSHQTALPDSKVDFVNYSLLSSNDIEKLRKGESFEVKAIVHKKADGDVRRRDLESWVEKNIEIGKTGAVEGVTRVGFDSISFDSKRLLQSLNMKISEDVIFIEAGKQPNSVGWGLFLLAISAVSALFGAWMVISWIRSPATQ